MAQYSVVEPPTDSGVPAQEALRKSIEEAAWSAGPFRFQPWLGLRDVSYVGSQQAASGAEDARNDGQLTVTAGAGLRAYAPIGAKVVWAAHLLPEYVWWQDDESKDGLAGRVGMAFFGYANHLEFQLSHRLSAQQSFFSDEVQELTLLTTATSIAAADLEVAQGVHLYGGWQRVDFEGNDEDDALFTLLDRVEDGWHAGVRLVSRRDWSVGVGFRQTDGEFDDGARDLSFEAEAVTFDMSAKVRKLGIGLELEDTEFTPVAGSQLAPANITLGNLQLLYRPRERLGLAAYAQRRREFSVRLAGSLLVTEEQGLRLMVQRNRLGVTLLAGTGSIDSASAETGAVDYDTWGAQLAWRIERLGSLQLSVVNRNYDEAPAALARDDVTTYGLAIQLGDLARRLSVGDARSVW